MQERLSKKIAKQPLGCWLWLGGLDGKGYGQFWLHGRHVQAHRVVYEQIVGPIPDGLSIDHLCRARNCVNPQHLEPVSILENIQRGYSANNGGHNKRKTACPQGHLYSEENTRLHFKRGYWRRECRLCDSMRSKDRRLKSQ